MPPEVPPAKRSDANTRDGGWQRIFVPPLRSSLCAALLLASAGTAVCATPEDYLQQRWFRIELVLFEQGIAWPPARPRQLDGMRLPLDAYALAPAEDAPLVMAEPWPIGVAPRRDDEVPLLISNIAPPLWLTGACGAVSNAESGAHDPCLPRVDLEALFKDDPTAVWAQDSVPAPATVPEEADPESAALEALQAAVAAHEEALLVSSYRWQPSTPMLERLLPRLRNAYRVVVAGSWHQPVPSRDRPQRLLVQAGTTDATGRFPVEGWLSVVAGRYVHLEGRLQYRSAAGDIALLRPQRRMADGEDHYIDHPAVGILARVDRLDAPQSLLDLIDAYEALAAQ